MASKFYRCYLKGFCHFVTTTTINTKPIFKIDRNAQLLLNCIYNFRKQQRYYLLGFVIMPTHMHILLIPKRDYNISAIMHSIKRSSSRLINRQNYLNGSIWMSSFYEHTTRNEEDFWEKLNYLYNNPVKAGLAEKPENYKYSSANSIYETDLELALNNYPQVETT